MKTKLVSNNKNEMNFTKHKKIVYESFTAQSHSQFKRFTEKV